VKRSSGLVFVIACVAGAGCGSGSGNKSNGHGGSGGGTGAGGGSAGSGTTTGDGGTCSFTACGGNLVGTWRFVDICGWGGTTACPPYQGVTVDRSSSTVTYTFGNDGSFQYLGSGTISETIHYPRECLATFGADAGIAQLCDTLESAVQMSIDNADAGPLTTLSSFTCDVNVEACVCREVFMNLSQTETGTYTTSGDQLTIMLTSATSQGAPVDAGTGGPSDYCVSGNTLTIHTISSSGAHVMATLTR